MDVEQFIKAHPLKGHPVSKESLSYKSAYIQCLEMLEIHKTNIYSHCAMEIYKKALLGKDRAATPHDNPQKCLKAAWKRRKFRKYLLVDMLHISGLSKDSTAAENFIPWLRSLLNWCQRGRFDALVAELYNKCNESAFQGSILSVHEDSEYFNRQFMSLPEKRILVTATMSAGKSTLINALIGKNISRVMNEACTAKLHYIYDKAFEDGFVHKLDYEMTFDADIDKLFTNDERNEKEIIYTAVHFAISARKRSRLCLIDTPGVNYSQDKTHADITRRLLRENDYHLLIYVMNAENLGTDDDHAHLKNVLTATNGRNVIFVINKLDKFDSEKDDLNESMAEVKNELVKIGFRSPTICPVSAKSALLTKRKSSELELSNRDERDLRYLQEQFNEYQYDFSRFYPELNKSDVTYNEHNEFLAKCGFLGLEQIITNEGKL